LLAEAEVEQTLILPQLVELEALEAVEMLELLHLDLLQMELLEQQILAVAEAELAMIQTLELFIQEEVAEVV
jgi:hypothetical protein